MMETREIQDGTKEEVPNEGSCDCSTGVNKDSGSLFFIDSINTTSTYEE